MKIKVNKASQIEEEIETLGATSTQARVIGAIVRGTVADILNERDGDVIEFMKNGNKYKLTLTKEIK